MIVTTVRHLHDSDQENAHILNVFYRGSEAVRGAVSGRFRAATHFLKLRRKLSPV